MNLVQHLLAFAALTAPIGSAMPDNPVRLCPILQRQAVQLEILDPREMQYILVRPEEFPVDLNMLRGRYRDLADAPLSREALRLPERSTANEFLSFNRVYRQLLEARQPLESTHAGQFLTAVQETDLLYQIWDTVRDARCEYYYVTVRRHALAHLRELIGGEAYYAGKLPPPVPLWRFESIP